MAKLCVLNGFPRSGKTTWGSFVAEGLQQRGISFAHPSSIAPIKALLQEDRVWQNPDLFPEEIWPRLAGLKSELVPEGQYWDGSEATKDAWRKTMSDLKNSVTDQFPDLLNNWVIDQALALPDPAVVFTDIREPGNIERFVSLAQERPGIDSVQTIFVDSPYAERTHGNSADSSVEDYNYSIRIDNPYDPNAHEASAVAFRQLAEQFIDRHLNFPPEGKPIVA